MYIKILITLVALPLFSACAITKLPELPASDVPEQWRASPGEEAVSWPELDWWNAFESNELSNIIMLLQDNNLDLAKENVQIALEQYQLGVINDIDLRAIQLKQVLPLERAPLAKAEGLYHSDSSRLSTSPHTIFVHP